MVSTGLLYTKLLYTNQLIIIHEPIMGLVHRNTFVVSTWNYTFVVTHEIHSMLVACYMLVHGNDIVIYSCEIQQIHVTF